MDWLLLFAIECNQQLSIARGYLSESNDATVLASISFVLLQR